MGKRVDITDKLNFEEKPVIIIKGKEIEVNDDAETVLKVLSKVEDEVDVTVGVLAGLANDIFTKEGKKNLDSLKLNIQDFSIVVEMAMDLIMGEDENQGELETDGMTSSRTGI